MITVVQFGDGVEIAKVHCPDDGLTVLRLRNILAENGVSGMLRKDGVVFGGDALLTPGTLITLAPQLPSRNEAHRRFASSSLLQWAPSALNCDVLKKLQNQREDGSNEPALLDFRPAYALPYIPLPLAHEVFGYFLDLVASNTKELPSKEDSLCFIKLVQITSRYFKKEEELVNEVYPVLHQYLKFDSLRRGLQVGRNAANIGLANSVHEDLMKLVLAFFEFKLLNSSTGIDPYTEGIQYINCFWEHYSTGFASYQDSCYPGFVIELVGPLLRVTAVARIGGKSCAQPLTPFINLLAMNGYNSAMMDLGVRVLFALKQSLHKLAEFYTSFRSSSGEVEAKFWDHSIPYPLHSLSTTPIKVGRLMYLVDMGGGRIRVVKFAERYGVAVHQAWALAGFAPPMSWSRLHGGWLQITMDYLGTGWEPLDKCRDADLLRPGVLEALKAAQLLPVQDGEKLGLGVHGDCRDCNVMVNRSGKLEVRFVDFERAGLHGVARYPQFMNHVQVNWPPGAEDNAIMDQQHDLQMISKPSFMQMKLFT